MFSKTLIWPVAVAWHLWRIATLRPAFDKLSDSARVVWSFIGVYFAAGLLRWVVLSPEAHATPLVFPVLLKLFVHLLVVMALFERRSRSSALTASVLGVSAIIDVAVCLLYGASAINSVHAGIGDIAAEIGLTVATALQFSNQPAAVRKSGYLKPARHA